MSKHRAPRTAARTVTATRGPGRHADTIPDEHVAGRLALVTLTAIGAVLLALVGIGAAHASPTAPAAPSVHQAGPQRIALDLPAVPGPQRTGAGTDLPAANPPADPLAALVADGAGSPDDVAAAAASLCGDDAAPARLIAAGWTEDQVTDLIDATDCD